MCRHLYNFGYEGWLDRLTDPRSRYAAGLSQDPLDNADPEGQGELPPTANSVIRAAYRELKDGTPENRILRARGGVPLSQSRAAAVASDNPPLFGPTPTCFVPVEEAEPFSNSIFGEAQ